jgi:hypothetical protein
MSTCLHFFVVKCFKLCLLIYLIVVRFVPFLIDLFFYFSAYFLKYKSRLGDYYAACVFVFPISNFEETVRPLQNFVGEICHWRRP